MKSFMTVPTRSLPLQRALLLSTLLLGACAQSPAPAPQVPSTSSGTPAPIITAPTPPVATVPGTATSTLKPVALMRLTFDQIGQDGASASAEPLSGVTGQALSAPGGLQMQAVSTGSFVLGARGAGGVRYLYATFKIRNADSSGAAYTTPRTNLTMLAVSTPATVGSTALSSLTKFDGSAADPSLAPAILPTHGMTFNRATDSASLLSGAEDLQVYSEAEAGAVPLTGTVTRVFPYGFVVRNPTNAASRTLPASPAAGQYDGVVTIAVKIPLQASAKDDVFRFSLNVLAADDSVTRVTESPEEQASSGAAARAALLGTGTQVATLCGTRYSGSNGVFMGSATTAGAAGLARSAHIGGNLALGALNLLPPTVFGNTTATVKAAGGLLSNYASYPATPGGSAATLSAAAGASTAGSTLNVAADGSYTFTPKVGDGSGSTETLNYTVSDGSGCTSPTLSLSAPITGRVWYVRNNGSNGDGRSGTPFSSLNSAVSASSAGDTLYVYRGDGSSNGQAGGVTLKASQRLIGSGAPLTLSGSTLQAADAAGAPSLGGVTLSTSNELSGLNITASGTGIKGSSFGTLTASAVSVTATNGPALDLTTGTLAASFTRLSSSSSAGNGVNLVDTPGSLTVSGDGSTAASGGTISGAALSGVSATGTSAVPSLSLNWMSVTGSKNNGVLYTVPSSSSAATSLVLGNSVLTDNLYNHVQVNLLGTGNATYALSNNTLSNPAAGLSGGIEVVSNHAGAATNQGRITGNTVTLKADGSGAGNGIAVYVNGAGVSPVQISGNTVRNYGTYGIDLAAQQGGGTLAATVSGNSVTFNPVAAQGLEGMRLNAGNATSGEAATLCLNLSGNTSAGNGNGYVVRWRTGNAYQLQGYSGGAADATAVAAFIKGRDGGANGVRIRTTGTGTITNFTGATCATPSF